MHVCEPCVPGAQKTKRDQMPRNWSYRLLSSTMWVLGIKSAISPLLFQLSHLCSSKFFTFMTKIVLILPCTKSCYFYSHFKNALRYFEGKNKGQMTERSSFSITKKVSYLFDISNEMEQHWISWTLFL